MHRLLSVRELDRDAVVGLDAVLHPVPPPHVDVVEAVEAAVQFGVDHRLDESVALGPAETCVGRRHLGEQPPLAVEEPQNLVRHGMRQDAVDQPDGLEGAQRLVVEPDTTGIVDEGVALIDDHGPDTLQSKDVGQGQAGRPGPDDDDVH